MLGEDGDGIHLLATAMAQGCLGSWSLGMGAHQCPACHFCKVTRPFAFVSKWSVLASTISLLRHPAHIDAFTG